MVEVRGTVHWLTHKDGPARALHVDPAARARLPRVLGDTGQVVWVTDAAGDDALEIDSVIDEPETETVRLAEGLLGNVLGLAASPDGATVAAAAHDGRLLAVDVTSGQVTELAASDNGAIDGLSWSPDSAWLAWSQPGTQPLRRIRMVKIADHEVIDVTDGRFTDTDPVSRSTASTSRSSPGAVSTRYTTSRPSTCRSPTAAARTWCRWPRKPRPRSARCPAAAR